ncbi:hypothetical protein F4859DRAFT_491599, partial [Xylaria cf. heliscus]
MQHLMRISLIGGNFDRINMRRSLYFSWKFIGYIYAMVTWRTIRFHLIASCPFTLYLDFVSCIFLRL